MKTTYDPRCLWTAEQVDLVRSFRLREMVGGEVWIRNRVEVMDHLAHSATLEVFETTDCKVDIRDMRVNYVDNDDLPCMVELLAWWEPQVDQVLALDGTDGYGYTLPGLPNRSITLAEANTAKWIRQDDARIAINHVEMVMDGWDQCARRWVYRHRSVVDARQRDK